MDRVGEDYPRMVHLSNPEFRPELPADNALECSQKFVDVLNLETGELESKFLPDLISEIGGSAVDTGRDGDLPFMQAASRDHRTPCAVLDNLLENTCLPRLMGKVFKKLEATYGKAFC